MEKKKHKYYKKGEYDFKIILKLKWELQIGQKL